MSNFYSPQPDDSSSSIMSVGSLFQNWDKQWGLRGDPFLWEELSQLLSKEPVPASLTQLVALIVRSFEQLVGVPLSAINESVYVPRYDHGGVSGGHICLSFWKNQAIPEIQRKYLSYITQLSAANSTPYISTSTPNAGRFVMKGPRFIDKPCRYEFYPEGCRFGTSCRFRHSFPARSDPASALNRQPSHPFGGNMLDSHNLYPPQSTMSAPTTTALGIVDKLGSKPANILHASAFSRLPQQQLLPSISSNSTYPLFHVTPNTTIDTLCPQITRGKCNLGDQCRYKHL